ncbi:DUF4185 domain-containing protein [Mucilaginibacter limnophilus]|uniref:DUF4185 domain-containing protein n=1 Tax=Mucilaginibacter limnophilus TaxID=1932778 RepID=A0A437MTL0_9SPHI|nr:DUF4185 domain-containing protein [Mucilaginibacter limnophilus]RVU00998.1 DUF4185 domain-containing protein [Mucilaginibacter limnophilus]
MKNPLMQTLIAVIFIFVMYGTAGAKAPAQQQGDTITAALPVNVKTVARVSGVAGAEDKLFNPNNTFRDYGIFTTDIGIMWETGTGAVMMAFGDNFGEKQSNWKSNAAAISADKNLADGLTITKFITDSGKVKELVISGQKKGQDKHAADYEVTCIPTGGIAVNKRQFINYMSVHQWALNGDNDQWLLNKSELIYSDDFGKNWTKSGVQWDGKGNFAQTAYLKKDGKVYMFGTPAGRYGNVFLSRVDEAEILNKPAYEYWNGSTWVKAETGAKAITVGTTAEMSVIYSSYYKRYFMVYLSVGRRAIVFRDAEGITGEWSGEKIIMPEDGNALYAPYFHPYSANTKDIYFIISHAAPIWNMFLVKAGISQDPAGFNLIGEGGFEDYPDNNISFRSPWYLPGSTATADSRSGKVACKLDNPETGVFKDAALQTVAVKPNTKYTLTGWAKASGDHFKNAYFGVRREDGTIKDFNPALNTGWTKISMTFNSGNNNTVNVFFGFWGEKDASTIIDDIKLTPYP